MSYNGVSPSGGGRGFIAHSGMSGHYLPHEVESGLDLPCILSHHVSSDPVHTALHGCANVLKRNGGFPQKDLICQNLQLSMVRRGWQGGWVYRNQELSERLTVGRKVRISAHCERFSRVQTGKWEVRGCRMSGGGSREGRKAGNESRNGFREGKT